MFDLFRRISLIFVKSRENKGGEFGKRYGALLRATATVRCAAFGAQPFNSRLLALRFFVANDHRERSATGVSALKLRFKAAPAAMQNHVNAGIP